MTDTATELSLTCERFIAAPPEKLYDAWLDPEMLAEFIRPGENMSVPKVEADPKVGGRFLIVMRLGKEDMPHSGTYKVLDRPKQLAFTWESPASRIEGSTVTIDFEKVSGGTHLRLTHVRFPTEESRNNHEGGWTRILATLAEEI
ncbi:MAG: SRPBCC domain-containing protein [Pseudomonadota bacterium]